MSDDRTRTILDRFNKKAKNQSYETTARRWSAESGTDNTKRHVYLPRLKTPPEWPSPHQNSSDLKRGKLTVVPPVQKKDAFVSNISPQKSKENDAVDSRLYLTQQQNPTNIFSGVPVVPYGQPIVTNGTMPYVYPPGLYPTPMYISYAPILPPIQNYEGYSIEPNRRRRFSSRDEAATFIQKHFKGWRVRKDSVIPKLQLLSNPHSARLFIEDFISEILEEEFIPDVLIEILSHKKSLSPYGLLYSMSNSICSDILSEDISYFLQLIAASVFYSQDKLDNLQRTDPLMQVCQDLTDEVVSEMSLITVQSTIKSLVQNHMTFSKSADWLEDLIFETIQPMIYSVALTSHAGYKYEATLDEIIDEVIHELIEPIIGEAWREVIYGHRHTQTIQVASFAEGRLLDSLFLNHLLGHLSGNNMSVYTRDYNEQTLDGLLCSVLLQQCMLVYDSSNDTSEPIKKYHQDTFAQLALDNVMDELCASLDEDMLDLLEKEKLDALSEHSY